MSLRLSNKFVALLTSVIAMVALAACEGAPTDIPTPAPQGSPTDMSKPTSGSAATPTPARASLCDRTEPDVVAELERETGRTCEDLINEPNIAAQLSFVAQRGGPYQRDLLYWAMREGVFPITPTPAPTTACYRGVADALELETGKSCLDITPADLAEVQELTIVGDYYTNRYLARLNSGDFDGLSNLRTLILQDNALASLPADIFSSLSNLEVLDLNDNDLTELPPGVFKGLSNLRGLDLGNNELTEFPPGVFKGLSNLYSLGLVGNELAELHDDTFDDLSNLRLLSLRANPGFPFVNLNVYEIHGVTPYAHRIRPD